MVGTLLSFGALFASALFFLMGGGVLNSQLSLGMAQEGFSTPTIGTTLACYYLGLMFGYFICHRLIQRVGHIRSFAAFAAVTTIIIILHGLYISAILWAVLRFFNGITSFGLYMIIESWLNECTEPRKRGRVFSVYMTLSYMGIGIGQQLLNFGNGGGQNVFFIAALLFSLSLIPVCVTQVVHPELPQTSRYTLTALFQKVPVGMLGCFAAGLTNSAFFSMAPVFGMKIGLSVFHLSWFMSITVVGGFAVQWIVGIISDRFDRTMILCIAAGLTAALSVVILITNGTSYYRFLVEMAIFGGLLFAIYPVAVARANDVFEGRDAVAVSSALLLCYSIGAVFGPILASALMTLLKTPYGLYVYWSLVAGILALVTVYLKRKERFIVIPVAEQVNFVPMKNTSSVAMVLDPRSDAEGEKLKV
jgi:MFS family permease